MAEPRILRITLETIEVPSVFSRRETTRDEAICMHTEKGTVILRRNTIVKAGGSWQKLRAKLWQDAQKNHIPIEDLCGTH